MRLFSRQTELPDTRERRRLRACRSRRARCLLLAAAVSAWVAWLSTACLASERAEAAAPGDARIEALRAWQTGRTEALPAPLPELARDPDPRVRIAALEAAARRRAPGAERLVQAALGDFDVQVRLAAIAALGEFGGPEAESSLRSLLDDRGELIRAAAVRALAARGDEQAMTRGAADRSWRVRLAVAEALGPRARPVAIHLARTLLSDQSAAVQGAVVRSVGGWPLEQSGPILLEALASNAFSTRLGASRQLAAAWPAAAEFPIDATPRQGAEALARLQAAFRSQFPSAAGGAAGSSAGDPRPRRVPSERLAEVQRLLGEASDPAATREARDATLRRLASLGRELIDALEILASDNPAAISEVVYRDVLPKCGAEFAAIGRLQSPEVADRRSAGAELAAGAGQRPLGRLALARLAQVAAREPDPLVWRSVLAAVAGDGSEPSIRLACAGAGHPAMEVRRAACEHLCRYPSPRHQAVLLPALDDPHTDVVRVAVRALGLGGTMQDRQPLRRLLGAADESLRVEAATALARLDDAAGPAALERLTYSRDPTIRRQAAAAMGQVPDPSYTATLIRLLDDHSSVRLAALDSLPKVTGQQPPEPDGPVGSGTAAKISWWKQSYRK